MTCAFAGRDLSGSLHLRAHRPCAGRLQDHHIIPRQEIRSRYKTMNYRDITPPFTLTAAIDDKRNQVKLCALEHHPALELHRIYLTRKELPEGIDDFAAELGLEWYLDRYFPRSAA